MRFLNSINPVNCKNIENNIQPFGSASDTTCTNRSIDPQQQKVSFVMIFEVLF
jgi:hypothetical protein